MGFPRVHTGARAILKIANNLIVFATNVQYSITTEYKEIQGVDNSLPEELAPTKISVTVRCTSLRVPQESASVLALQPTILNHLQQKYLSIELLDRGTNETILYVPKAMLVERSGIVATRQMANETWVLKGIGYWDERPPQGASNDRDSDNFVDKVAALGKKIRNQ